MADYDGWGNELNEVYGDVRGRIILERMILLIVMHIGITTVSHDELGS